MVIHVSQGSATLENTVDIAYTTEKPTKKKKKAEKSKLKKIKKEEEKIIVEKKDEKHWECYSGESWGEEEKKGSRRGSWGAFEEKV